METVIENKSLSISPVSSVNIRQLLSLKVMACQQGYIESISECLTDAERDQRYNAVALYEYEILIGFAMYGMFEENHVHRVWLDRLLIDKSHQGRGLGEQFTKILIKLLVRKYHQNRIFLSVFPDNHAAISLYKKLGFNFNGELDINGEKIMVLRLNQ